MALCRQQAEPRTRRAAGPGSTTSSKRPGRHRRASALQPSEIIPVTNPEARTKIRAIAWNQKRVTEGSHLLVFAAWDNDTVDRINHMFDLTHEVRGFEHAGWENDRQQLLKTCRPRPKQKCRARRWKASIATSSTRS